MRNTATQKFFHGRRKSTKKGDATVVKFTLDTSRSRKNSYSKPKTNKLFQTSRTNSKGIFNHTMTAPQHFSSTAHFKPYKSEFGLPVPFQDMKRPFHLRHRQLSKTSRQDSFNTTVQDLHALVDRHTSRPETSVEHLENKRYIQAGTQNNQNYTISFNASANLKFKRKLQENAKRMFNTFQQFHPTAMTDRIQQKETKKLVELLNKMKCQSKKQINFQEKVQEVQKNVQNVRKQTTKETKTVTYDNFQSKQPLNENRFVKNEGNDPKQIKESVEIRNDNEGQRRQEQSGKLSQKIKPTVQINQQGVSKKPYTQKTILENQKPKVQKKVTIKLQNKVLEQQVSVPSPVPETNVRKSNSFWVTDDFQIPEIPQVIQTKQQATKQQTSKNIQQTKNPKTDKSIKAYTKSFTQQKQQQKKPIQKQVQQLQELDCIDFTNANKNDTKGRTNLVDHRNRTMTAVPITKSNTPSSEVINPNTSRKQEKGENKKLQNNKNNTKITSDAQLSENYSDSQVKEQFDYNLYLINQLGQYCRYTKKFQQISKISQQTYLTNCFFLWHQLFFERQKCISILKSKKEPWFSISVSMINRPSLKDFIDGEVKKLQKEHKKCEQSLIQYFNAAKKYLTSDEVKTGINVKIDYSKKCLQLIQKQFKESQKVYKQYIKTKDKNEQAMSQRLCRLIQLFCNIKFLRAEQVEQPEQMEQETDLHQYYNRYKHLILL